MQGNPPTLRQPFANPVPTLRQPFANPLPTFSSDPSPSPSLRGTRLETRVNASWIYGARIRSVIISGCRIFGHLSIVLSIFAIGSCSFRLWDNESLYAMATSALGSTNPPVERQHVPNIECSPWIAQNIALMIRRGKGSRPVGGTRLVVFPRSNRPQFEKATSRDPLSSWDPLPLAPSQRGAGGGGGSWLEGGGPGSKGGRGPGSWCSSACTGSRSVGIPRAGSPQRAGTPRIFPYEGTFWAI